MDACTHTSTHTCKHKVKPFLYATRTKSFEPLISLLLHAQNVKLLKNTAYFRAFSPSSLMFKLENHRAPTLVDTEVCVEQLKG